MTAVTAVLTVEEEAGVLDAQSVRGHAGVVPIVLLGDVGDHEDGHGAEDRSFNEYFYCFGTLSSY